MLTEKQEAAFDRYVDTAFNLLSSYQHTQLTEHDKFVLARLMSQMIYELPKVHSGKASTEAIRKKLSDFSWQPSKDHFHVRSVGGMLLVELLPGSLSKESIRGILLQHAEVHFVTSEENTKLRPFQRKNPTTAYEAANIELHNCLDLFSKRGKSKAWKEQITAALGCCLLS